MHTYTGFINLIYNAIKSVQTCMTCNFFIEPSVVASQCRCRCVLCYRSASLSHTPQAFCYILLLFYCFMVLFRFAWNQTCRRRTKVSGRRYKTSWEGGGATRSMGKITLSKQNGELHIKKKASRVNATLFTFFWILLTLFGGVKLNLPHSLWLDLSSGRQKAALILYIILPHSLI